MSLNATDESDRREAIVIAAEAWAKTYRAMWADLYHSKDGWGRKQELVDANNQARTALLAIIPEADHA